MNILQAKNCLNAKLLSISACQTGTILWLINLLCVYGDRHLSFYYTESVILWNGIVTRNLSLETVWYGQCSQLACLASLVIAVNQFIFLFVGKINPLNECRRIRSWKLINHNLFHCVHRVIYCCLNIFHPLNSWVISESLTTWLKWWQSVNKVLTYRLRT